MNQRHRLKEILLHLKNNLELSVSDACRLSQVSPATTRRDFQTLTQNKQAIKTWGGIALLVSPEEDTSMLPVAYREALHSKEKKIIAESAASMVQEGDVIFIDGGSTTFFMTKYLAGKKIRVITNSILIAYQIDKEQDRKKGAEVFLTGGLVYPEAGLVVGPQCIENIRKYHAKYTFLSVGGIDNGQLTNSNQLVVETEIALIEQSEKVIVLADKSKLGKCSMCKICDVREADVIITNQNSEYPSLLNQIRNSGVEVLEL